ncbi:hypothetical protein ACT3TH_04905 [Psychrobacter sp. AOP22-C1-C5]|uniref:hypothetical protein n=1 Tax=Psychrobacter sp. AOP22-C1-C5 TaxID=3457716 RepID=UPI00403576B8
MDKLIQNVLLDLKRQVVSDYQPIEVSTKAMSFLLKYSHEIPYEFHSDLHSLIAMDMGDEFILPQSECVQIIDRLLTLKSSGES